MVGIGYKVIVGTGFIGVIEGDGFSISVGVGVSVGLGNSGVVGVGGFVG